MTASTHGLARPPLLSDRIEALALHQRDAMREWVCQPRILAMTQSALEARLRQGTRDGVRNVLTLMGFVREAPVVQVAIQNLLVSLDVQSETEAKRYIEIARAGLNMAPRERVRLYVRALLEERREDATMVEEELGPLLSRADAAESTNGRADVMP